MAEFHKIITNSINDSCKAIASLEQQIDRIQQAVDAAVSALHDRKKLMFIGNGGSAADAQHAAAEFVGRLGLGANRGPLPAIALTTDTSAITAIANDFGFQEVFSRQVEALAMPGDVLFCISTSGKSPNIILAAESAKKRGCSVICLTGPMDSPLSQICDIILKIDGPNTPRIQEAHSLALHIICECTELALCD